MSAITLSIFRAPRAGLWALALAAGLALPAFADGPSGGPPRGGPGFGDHAMGGHGGPMAMGDPAHVGHMAERMLDGLNATDAQRAQIRQITQAAAADMKPLRDAERALHEKGTQLLLAPTIDPAAAESLRQQMVAQHDQVSKRMLQTLLAVANVLTPQQRAKLGERMKLHGDMMRERMQRVQPAASEPKS